MVMRTLMPTPLEYAIISTLAYYDGFSFPLTAFEIWKWLQLDGSGIIPSFGDVQQTLGESLFLHGKIERRDGMYVLRGRSDIVNIRKERYLLAERKYQRLGRAMRLLRFLPFIRAIAVCNSLAFSNARDESDLDLLIVTDRNHLWTTRMFATGLAALFRWRPTPERSRDTLCLSFYLSDPAQSLAPLVLPGDDIYMRYWLDHLVPIYGESALIEKLRAANAWHRDRLPNAYGVVPASRRRTEDTRVSRFLKRGLELLHGGTAGQMLEGWYRGWQQKHLPEKLKALVNTDTRVVMNETMLKFHENDRREAFSRQHALRLKEVLGT